MARGRKAVAKSTSVDIKDLAVESGVVSQGSFTKHEALALRILMAFIEGKSGSVGADIVNDVWAIADRFAEKAGWDD